MAPTIGPDHPVDLLPFTLHLFAQEPCKAAKAATDARGLLFQIHVAETRTERERTIAEQGCSPVAYLNRLGLLDGNTLVVHAVWVDPADIEMLSATGARVSHNPESNMKLAAGIAPVPEMIAAGVTVGLGTDGCASNNDLDLFGEMDTAAKIHKARTLDPIGHGCRHRAAHGDHRRRTAPSVWPMRSVPSKSASRPT